MPHADPEQRRKYLAEWKKRNPGKVWYYRNSPANRHKNYAWVKAWKIRNKEKCAEYGRKYREKYREALNAKSRKWRKIHILEHRKHHAAEERRRRAENPEPHRQASRAYAASHHLERLAYSREWRVRNRDKESQSAARKRARKLRAPGTHTFLE